MEDKCYYLMEVNRGDIRLLAIIGDKSTGSHRPDVGDLVRIGNDLWDVCKVSYLTTSSEFDREVIDVTAGFVTKADAMYKAVKADGAA